MTENGTLYLTMGDPAGIGPEITLKALAALSQERRAKVIVIGTRSVLDATQQAIGTALTIEDAGSSGDGSLRLIDIDMEGLDFAPGELAAANGEASFRYIERAVREAQAATGPSCIVTAPINKEALNLAGHHYDGHTGLLAHLTGCTSSWMMLTSQDLTVVHVSTHVSLHDAVERATTNRVLETIRITDKHLRRLHGGQPRIAVSGINPHCGENGLFGTEDDTRLKPAVDAARQEGINVTGPVSGDSVYRQAATGEFDAVIAQYHDQGHIPMKMIAFDTAVNVTLGLPIDRTSVDHGTAYGIAGKNLADYTNMACAIAEAELLIERPYKGAK